MKRRLLFFTSHYPRGNAVLWKYDDICAMAAHFDEVVVVPTHATKPVMVTRTHPENVRFEDPILSGAAARPRRMGPRTGAQFAELWRQVLTLDRRRIASCLRSISLQRRYLAEAERRGLFRSDADETWMFFYWGRGAAEILGGLPEGVATHAAVALHRFDLYEEESPINYLPFRTAIYSRADVLAPCSAHGADYLRRKYPAYADRVRVKRLGVEDFGHSPHVPDGPLKIVSCAFAKPVKRLDRIISILARTRTDFVWTHIGDGPELPALQRAVAEQLTAPGQQVVFTGHLAAHDVRSRLADDPHDLFLSVSASEGVPVSIMEALSAGIPVMATDAGGTRELIDDDWLLPLDFDDDEVARKIDAYAAKPLAEKAAAREAARQRADDRARAPRVNREFAGAVYGVADAGQDAS